MLSSITARAKNFHISKLEVVLLFFLLVLGIPMIVLIPPGAGYDEEDHLVRVWEISAFSFIPGQMSPQEMKYPVLFRDFAYRQQGSTGVIKPVFWQNYGRASLYENGFVRREINTKSVYAPALLLPQAMTLRLLGRHLNLAALPVFYACRFASLLSYLLLVWLAVRWIPFGKRVLLVLVLTPMALFQAATISPDAISNGIGFLFIAGCLRAKGFKEIGWREFGNIVFLILLLFLAKLNLAILVLLPFLVIQPSRFSRKGMHVALAGITILLFLVEVAGWNAITTRYMDPVVANEASIPDQLVYVSRHPFRFLQTLLTDVSTNGLAYLQGWINGYGYYYWNPPPFVSLLFLLSLAIALVSTSGFEGGDLKFRIVLLLVFIAGYLATVISLYAFFTPVGSDQILGVQGRYFVPLAPLFFLAVAGTPALSKLATLSLKWVVILLTFALSLNVLGIFLSFHVPCGSTYFQNELCYRPLFRDFSSETYTSQPVSSTLALAQEIQVECDGFTEIRFLALPSASGSQGNTRFLLRDATTGQILLETSITSDQVTAEDWYPLRFPPGWHSTGKQYVLEITSADAWGGLRFLYTPQSEFDLGNLYENGMPIQDDLVLQYGCATGLRKIWLTSQP